MAMDGADESDDVTSPYSSDILQTVSMARKKMSVLVDDDDRDEKMAWHSRPPSIVLC